MRGQQQSFPESIDDVLSAVEETPRGRWFLQAYAERLKKGETAAILASIDKLEASLKSMMVSGTESRLIETTRAAIAQARQEINALNPDIAALSPEGQLFAKLAEQSRQAFGGTSGTPAIGKSVERAIRLVADIERNFADPAKAPMAAPANPSAYFKQDEAIFEPAPAKPRVIMAEAKPAAELPTRGARLVIERIGETTRLPPPVEPDIDQRAADVFASPPTADAEQKPRITIIRHEVEDLPEVPLPDMMAKHETTSAA